MTTEKRIKLAEAMGLRVSKQGVAFIGGVWRVFDPFTDANDDYAVLEWMRETFTLEQMRVACDALLATWEKHLDDSPIDAELPYSWFREIGDYANAALKVIEGTSE